MSRDSRLLRDPAQNPDPHSVSLKVLRLSRPSFAEQHPLPRNNPTIPQSLSLASLPTDSPDSDFVLSPLLSLPQSFGSVYVGETFTCSLSANNELLSAQTNKSVSAIRLVAEIQSPSHSTPLELQQSRSGSIGNLDNLDDLDNELDDSKPIAPGTSLQHIVRFDLKEQGKHVLAVNVSYAESTLDPNGHQTSGRIRTFRKLYQFEAQACLGVRTKATELAASENPTDSKSRLLRYVLEAQLENLNEDILVLESAVLQARRPFKATSLNWDMPSDVKEDDQEIIKLPTLSPRDVMQVAFLVEQQPGVAEGLDDLTASLKRDGRVSLGQLTIGWRSAMGEPGSLSTGNLMTRRG